MANLRMTQDKHREAVLLKSLSIEDFTLRRAMREKLSDLTDSERAELEKRVLNALGRQELPTKPLEKMYLLDHLQTSGLLPGLNLVGVPASFTVNADADFKYQSAGPGTLGGTTATSKTQQDLSGTSGFRIGADGQVIYGRPVGEDSNIYGSTPRGIVDTTSVDSDLRAPSSKAESSDIFEDNEFVDFGENNNRKQPTEADQLKGDYLDPATLSMELQALIQDLSDDMHPAKRREVR
jgi:hypothetical protein